MDPSRRGGRSGQSASCPGKSKSAASRGSLDGSLFMLSNAERLSSRRISGASRRSFAEDTRTPFSNDRDPQNAHDGNPQNVDGRSSLRTATDNSKKNDNLDDLLEDALLAQGRERPMYKPKDRATPFAPLLSSNRRRVLEGDDEPRNSDRVPPDARGIFCSPFKSRGRNPDSSFENLDSSFDSKLAEKSRRSFENSRRSDPTSTESRRRDPTSAECALDTYIHSYVHSAGFRGLGDDKSATPYEIHRNSPLRYRIEQRNAAIARQLDMERLLDEGDLFEGELHNSLPSSENNAENADVIAKVRPVGDVAVGKSPGDSVVGEFIEEEISFQETNSENVAATMLQPALRGTQDRKLVEEMKGRSKEPPAEAVAAPSAEEISFEGTRAQNVAATKLQSTFRGEQDRKAVEEMKRSKSPPSEAIATPAKEEISFEGTGAQNVAATTLQSAFRGSQDPKAVEEMKRTKSPPSEAVATSANEEISFEGTTAQNVVATKLQSTFRGKQDRKAIEEMKRSKSPPSEAVATSAKEEISFEGTRAQNVVATKLQSTFRGKPDRKAVQEMKGEPAHATTGQQKKPAAKPDKPKEQPEHKSGKLIEQPLLSQGRTEQTQRKRLEQMLTEISSLTKNGINSVVDGWKREHPRKIADVMETDQNQRNADRHLLEHQTKRENDLLEQQTKISVASSELEEQTKASASSLESDLMFKILSERNAELKRTKELQEWAQKMEAKNYPRETAIDKPSENKNVDIKPVVDDTAKEATLTDTDVNVTTEDVAKSETAAVDASEASRDGRAKSQDTPATEDYSDYNVVRVGGAEENEPYTEEDAPHTDDQQSQGPKQGITVRAKPKVDGFFAQRQQPVPAKRVKRKMNRANDGNPVEDTDRDIADKDVQGPPAEDMLDYAPLGDLKGGTSDASSMRAARELDHLVSAISLGGAEAPSWAVDAAVASLTEAFEGDYVNLYRDYNVQHGNQQTAESVHEWYTGGAPPGPHKPIDIPDTVTESLLRRITKEWPEGLTLGQLLHALGAVAVKYRNQLRALERRNEIYEQENHYLHARVHQIHRKVTAADLRAELEQELLKDLTEMERFYQNREMNRLQFTEKKFKAVLQAETMEIQAEMDLLLEENLALRRQSKKEKELYEERIATMKTLHESQMESIKAAYSTRVDILNTEFREIVSTFRMEKDRLVQEQEILQDQVRRQQKSMNNVLENTELEKRKHIINNKKLYDQTDMSRLKIEHEIQIVKLKEDMIRMQAASYAMERLYVKALERAVEDPSGIRQAFLNAGLDDKKLSGLFGPGKREKLQDKIDSLKGSQVLHESAAAARGAEAVLSDENHQIREVIDTVVRSAPTDDDFEKRLVSGVTEHAITQAEKRAGINTNFALECPSCEGTRQKANLDLLRMMETFNSEIQDLQEQYKARRRQTNQEYWLCTTKQKNMTIRKNSDGTMTYLPRTRFDQLVDIFEIRQERQLLQKTVMNWFHNSRFQQLAREFHNHVNANYVLLSQKRMILANISTFRTGIKNLKWQVQAEMTSFWDDLVKQPGGLMEQCLDYSMKMLGVKKSLREYNLSLWSRPTYFATRMASPDTKLPPALPGWNQLGGNYQGRPIIEHAQAYPQEARAYPPADTRAYPPADKGTYPPADKGTYPPADRAALPDAGAYVDTWKSVSKQQQLPTRPAYEDWGKGKPGYYADPYAGKGADPYAGKGADPYAGKKSEEKIEKKKPEKINLEGLKYMDKLKKIEVQHGKIKRQERDVADEHNNIDRKIAKAQKEIKPAAEKVTAAEEKVLATLEEAAGAGGLFGMFASKSTDDYRKDAENNLATFTKQNNAFLDVKAKIQDLERLKKQLSLDLAGVKKAHVEQKMDVVQEELERQEEQGAPEHVVKKLHTELRDQKKRLPVFEDKIENLMEHYNRMQEKLESERETAAGRKALLEKKIELAFMEGEGAHADEVRAKLQTEIQQQENVIEEKKEEEAKVEVAIEAEKEAKLEAAKERAERNKERTDRGEPPEAEPRDKKDDDSAFGTEEEKKEQSHARLSAAEAAFPLDSEEVISGDENEAKKEDDSGKKIMTRDEDEAKEEGDPDKKIMTRDEDEAKEKGEPDKEIMTRDEDETKEEGEPDKKIITHDDDEAKEEGKPDRKIMTRDGDEAKEGGDPDKKIISGEEDEAKEEGHPDKKIMTRDEDEAKEEGEPDGEEREVLKASGKSLRESITKVQKTSREVIKSWKITMLEEEKRKDEEKAKKMEEQVAHVRQKMNRDVIKMLKQLREFEKKSSKPAELPETGASNPGSIAKKTS